MRLPGQRRGPDGRQRVDTRPALSGHVTVHDANWPVPVDGAEDHHDWEHMHMALAAWKARRLLTQARSELQEGARDRATDPRLAAQLYAADELVEQAIAALASVASDEP